jgi:hypothetical protein
MIFDNFYGGNYKLYIIISILIIGLIIVSILYFNKNDSKIINTNTDHNKVKKQINLQENTNRDININNSNIDDNGSGGSGGNA